MSFYVRILIKHLTKLHFEKRAMFPLRVLEELFEHPA